MTKKRQALHNTADFALNRTLTMPLHRQLYDRLRHTILSGQLQPGHLLPSTRVLASELGISLNTVNNAYDQLCAEGYIERRVGQGTRVACDLPETFFLPKGCPQRNAALDETPHTTLFLSHLGEALMSQATASSIQTYRRSTPPRAFRTGTPDLHAFPFQQWSQVAAHCARSLLKHMGTYQEVAGFYPLREAIASHVSITRGVHCQAEQVLIVPGAQTALDLAARLLLNPGDLAWIENPGYPGAQRALLNAGAQLAPIPVTSEGINVAIGQKRYPHGRLAYVTPSHQFPLGITMHLSQRVALLQWAKQANAWILEDDYDSEYRFSGRPLDALQGLDLAQRVIYIGTFSKVLFPSLRIGYLILPPQLIPPFLALCSYTHIHVPILDQLTLEAWITKGHMLRHIHRMRDLYAARRALLIESLQKELGGCIEVLPPQAGLHLMGWLPPNFDDQHMTQQAANCGVEIIPVSAMTLGSSLRGGLVLGYGAVNEQEIQAGVRQLVSIFPS
ncbi:PLP-dependent aminotransferase family protein [Ktedonospora formicarum]|uniref:GntR family transcriptional regulator n=1 Tax=Ktedonospora formicarum TaxID=2778364 RepID=A0A8J3I656_9CHLR|nr:PLP-dependent aminotransferase family protein [Ktedonospora formicarum]GHO47813.1 GntR family transcriptional regulator [Ktedonospora formicarum]